MISHRVGFTGTGWGAKVSAGLKGLIKKMDSVNAISVDLVDYR